MAQEIGVSTFTIYSWKAEYGRLYVRVDSSTLGRYS
jgi:hypothetical protein